MTVYADRYGAGSKFKPGSTGLALALTVLPVAGLVVSLQVQQFIKARDPNTTLIDLTRPPPPPPPDPVHKKVDKAPQLEKIYVPPVAPPIPTLPPVDVTPIRSLDPPPMGPIGKALDPAPVAPVEPVKPPVMVGAQFDSRYASALKPPFPPEELRAGRDGRVELRVLIGTDGRVKDVQKVSATSDAFFASAQRQALSKWRFKPATRDGTPVEQWKTMGLSFRVEDAQ